MWRRCSRRAPRKFEHGRRIPMDIIDAIKPSGVYRMLVPRSHAASD
jgi:hypothetical protein